jgi:cysteine synthase A
MGIGEILKQQNPNTKIIAIEPAESPVMSGGQLVTWNSRNW